MRMRTIRAALVGTALLLGGGEKALATVLTDGRVSDFTFGGGWFANAAPGGAFARSFWISGTDPNGAILNPTSGALATSLTVPLGPGSYDFTILTDMQPGSGYLFGPTSRTRTDANFGGPGLSVFSQAADGPQVAQFTIAMEQITLTFLSFADSGTIDRVQYSSSDGFTGNEGSDSVTHIRIDVQAVPEPASLALMGLGGLLAFVGLARRARRKR